MILTALKNPFFAQKVDDTLTVPPGDVPELHEKVRAKCRIALAQAQQSGQSIGLLVIGEAGSGKSHLIAQLRRELASDTRVVLATIPLGGAHAGRLWRHVRARFVAELFRPYPDRGDALNGLFRLLRNRFPKWTSDQCSKGGIMRILVPMARGSLQPYLEEFAQKCPLDYALQKVLCKLENPQLNSLGQAWLRGQQLDSEDLTALGLPVAFPSEQEQETIAREVVLSLFRLAGETTSLFLCFDEVEAIQAGSYDAASLRQFSTLATDLLAEPGPRVVATFIRPNLQVEVCKAVEASNMQKMGQNRTVIPPISWEQTVRLTKARLEAEPACRSGCLDNPNHSYWPLGQEFVRRVFETNKRSLTPRHLIRACAVEFERLQEEDVPGDDGETQGNGREEDSVPIIIIDPGPPRPDAEFARMWEKQRQKFLKKPQGISFDTVLAIGLPWLVHLLELPLVWVQEPKQSLGDVNLLFQSKVRGRKSLGISFCNHEPRSLWRRLDRLHAQWTGSAGKLLGSLVVLRGQAERTPEGSASRLTTLTKAGANVVRIEAQPLAELAAYQAMLTAAQGGDLTRSGKPVERAEYDAWARDHLSAAVKELLDFVFAK